MCTIGESSGSDLHVAAEAGGGVDQGADLELLEPDAEDAISPGTAQGPEPVRAGHRLAKV